MMSVLVNMQIEGRLAASKYFKHSSKPFMCVLRIDGQSETGMKITCVRMSK